MIKTRLIVAASAAAIGLAMLAAPASAAMTTHKYPVHVVVKQHDRYVSGKIVHISYKHRTLTLSNGKTYKVGKVLRSYKVGHWVRIRIS